MTGGYGTCSHSRDLVMNSDNYTHCHVQQGGALVQRRIDRVHVPLLWARAPSQVQVVQLGVSDRRVVMVEFVLEYLQLPPRARIPTCVVQDQELMEG